MVRAEGGHSNDKITGKIQQGEQAKVHTMLVIGPRDMAAGAVSVRRPRQGQSGGEAEGGSRGGDGESNSRAERLGSCGILCLGFTPDQ